MLNAQSSAHQTFSSETIKKDSEESVDALIPHELDVFCGSGIKADKVEMDEFNVFKTASVMPMKKEAEDIPSIKIEEVDVATEFNTEKVRLVTLLSESMKKEVDYGEVTIKQEEIDLFDEESTPKQDDVKTFEYNETSLCHDYYFENYGLSTSREDRLDIKDHLKSNKVPIYKCTVCLYKTKFKSYLRNHLNLHLSAKGINIYKCTTCDFQTRYKTSLAEHLKMHLVSDEVKFYKCETCDFQTKVTAETRLTATKGFPLESTKNKPEDMITIKSEIFKKEIDDVGVTIKLEEIYIPEYIESCQEQESTYPENYDFSASKSKTTLHLINHQKTQSGIDEVKKYKCETCDFKTNHWFGLKKHKILHLNPDKVKLYKCKTCSFQTKCKGYLMIHQRRHLNLDEVEVYECDTCEFITKDKNYLRKHLNRHSSLEDVDVYNCATCQFQTRHKKRLIEHLKRHSNGDKVRLYKCKTCSFQTKYRRNLGYHQKMHLNLDEVKLYRCETCDFQTKHKHSLKRHQKGHKRETRHKTINGPTHAKRRCNVDVEHNYCKNLVLRKLSGGKSRI